MGEYVSGLLVVIGAVIGWIIAKTIEKKRYIKEDKVPVEFTKYQALVLFDLLSSAIDFENTFRSDSNSLAIKHPAEFWALNSLLCDFESILVEPFLPNYNEIIEQARKEMVEKTF